MNIFSKPTLIIVPEFKGKVGSSGKKFSKEGKKKMFFVVVITVIIVIIVLVPVVMLLLFVVIIDYCSRV